LNIEITTVHEKNISSVFYAEKVAVDVAHHQGQISGLLYRTSHGLQLNPQHETYQIQFSFAHGLLSLNSIKEASDATHH
jgi:conjugal transfer pilus assembly protein TraE